MPCCMRLDVVITLRRSFEKRLIAWPAGSRALVVGQRISPRPTSGPTVGADSANTERGVVDAALNASTVVTRRCRAPHRRQLPLALRDEGAFTTVTDRLSPDALSLARENGEATRARLTCLQGDLHTGREDGRSISLVSNPPYLTTASTTPWMRRFAITTGNGAREWRRRPRGERRCLPRGSTCETGR